MEKFLNDFFKINIKNYEDLINIESTFYFARKLFYNKFKFGNNHLNKELKKDFFSISIEKSKFEIKMIVENETKYSLNLEYNDSKIKLTTFYSFDLSTHIDFSNYLLSGIYILFNDLSNKKNKYDVIEYAEFNLDNMLIENYILVGEKKYYIQENIDFCNNYLIKRTNYNELLAELSYSFFWISEKKEGFNIFYDISEKEYTKYKYLPELYDNISTMVINYLYETGKDLTSLNVRDLELVKIIEYS